MYEKFLKRTKQPSHIFVSKKNSYQLSNEYRSLISRNGDDIFQKKLASNFIPNTFTKTPNVGLEPTTLRLRVSCSTY